MAGLGEMLAGMFGGPQMQSAGGAVVGSDGRVNWGNSSGPDGNAADFFRADAAMRGAANAPVNNGANAMRFAPAGARPAAASTAGGPPIAPSASDDSYGYAGAPGASLMSELLRSGATRPYTESNPAPAIEPFRQPVPASVAMQGAPSSPPAWVGLKQGTPAPFAAPGLPPMQFAPSVAAARIAAPMPARVPEVLSPLNTVQNQFRTVVDGLPPMLDSRFTPNPNNQFVPKQNPRNKYSRD